MKKKNEIEKVCAYCEYGAKLKDDNYMLCKTRGVVASSFSCRKFLYDPLKRVPARPILTLEESSEE